MPRVEVDAVVSGRDDGPAVVLSNSIGATRAMWDPQLAALEGHFRVIRYDTRGHGSSPAPAGPYTVDDLADDVTGLLDRYAVERAHLVGLSLGGATALRIAQRAPERVDRLAVLCTSALFAPAQGWHDRAALARAEGLQGIATTSMERWFTAGFRGDHDVEPYAAMIAGNDPEGYAGCCEALASLDLRADLAGIAAPTLVVAGAEDPATPPDRLRAIADAVPHSHYLEVPRASHLANLERPDIITPALVDFLRGTQ